MAGNADLFGEEEGAPTGDFPEKSAFEQAVEDAGEKLGRPGRPRGARNKRDVDFERWYGAMGFKDPAQFLAEMVSGDPLALRELVKANSPGGKGTPGLLDVIKVQIAAAGELMPYLHGKKPTEILVSDERLPSLIIDLGTNQNAIGAGIAAAKALSAGSPLELDQDDDQDAEAETENPSNSGTFEGEE